MPSALSSLASMRWTPGNARRSLDSAGLPATAGVDRRVPGAALRDETPRSSPPPAPVRQTASMSICQSHPMRSPTSCVEDVRN
jgi:hypothetical protein